MNLTALQAAVRMRLGVSATDPTYADATLTGFINAGLHYIASARDWPWLEVVVTDDTSTDGSYSAPARMMRVGSLTIQDIPYDLVPVRRIYAEANDGITYAFAVAADTILYRPLPGSVTVDGLVLTYFGDEIDLATGSDEPILPARFHHGLCDYAASLCLRRVGNVDEAERWLASYMTWERRMIDETTRSAGPRQVFVRPGCGI